MNQRLFVRPGRPTHVIQQIEGRSMTELKVNLDFDCASCEQCVGVTVTCAGAALSSSSRLFASVAVPCPNCQIVNRVLFEPDGTVRDVASLPHSRLPEPSCN
jgi:hypothetical protein